MFYFILLYFLWLTQSFFLSNLMSLFPLLREMFYVIYFKELPSLYFHSFHFGLLSTSYASYAICYLY